MNGGKPVVNPFGFTILEVMVVLAVTLVIFASAVVTISGRTQTAVFMQEVNDVQSRLQAIMNDVSTGTFNTDKNLSCSVVNNQLQFGSAQPNDAGDCIFLGNAVLFTTGNLYYEFEVFGARQDIGGSGALAVDYQETQPTIPSDTNLVSTESLDNELYANSVTYTVAGNATPMKTDMVAFLDDPNAADASGVVLPQVGYDTSGAIGVNVIPVEDGYNLKSTQTLATPADAVGQAMTDANVNPVGGNPTPPLATSADGLENPASGVQICFASQSTNQSVKFTIGGSNRSTTIENQIYSGATC